MEICMNTQMIRRSVILLFISLTFFAYNGCSALQSKSSEVDSDLLGFDELRATAVDNAVLFKATFMGKENSSEYFEAKSKYKDAERKFNSWLKYLGLLTVKGEDVPSSDVYKDYTNKAGAAFAEFNNYVNDKIKSQLGLKGLVAGDAIAGAIEGIGKVGVEWWKAKKELEQKDRQMAATYIHDNYSWPKWENIKNK